MSQEEALIENEWINVFRVSLNIKNTFASVFLMLLVFSFDIFYSL